MGAFCGPCSEWHHLHPHSTDQNSQATKSVGKVPGGSAGGVSRAWRLGVFVAGKATVSPSHTPSTDGGHAVWDGHWDHCACAGLAPRASLSDLLQLLSSDSCSLSDGAYFLFSSCDWRKVSCSATEGFRGEML